MLLNILDRGDVCTLFVAVLILAFAGSRVSDQGQQRWGTGLAILAFLAYGGYAWGTHRPATAEGLLDIVIRSLAAGGLVLGLSWITLPVLHFFFRHGIALPWQRLQADAREARRRHEERRRQRADEKIRQRSQMAMSPQEQERQRVQREEEAKAQRRREDFRLACEILYASLQPEIAPRFSREMFDDFIRRHMGDDQSPERVEERARQLQAVMQRHLEKVEPPPQSSEAADVVAVYNRQVERVNAAGLDEEARESTLLALRDQLINRLRRMTEEL